MSLLLFSTLFLDITGDESTFGSLTVGGKHVLMGTWQESFSPFSVTFWTMINEISVLTGLNKMLIFAYFSE